MSKPNNAKAAKKIEADYKAAKKSIPALFTAKRITIDLVDSAPEPKIAVISNSDRALFRKCRRAWNWSSHLRMSFAPKRQASPFWFGSGIHYAMEDQFGYQHYQSPEAAFDDYVQATVKHFGVDNLPVEWRSLHELAHSMFYYYRELWLGARTRDPLKTLWINGVPQVEVPLEFEIPVDPAILEKRGYDRAVCRFIIDRIVEDEYGILWVNDYKAVAKFTSKEVLELDPQITQYLLGVQLLFDRPFGGFIYQQHLKAACNTPKINKNGSISVDKKQGSCYILYRRALVEKYKQLTNASEDQTETLNYYLGLEQENADPFVRREYVTRNAMVIANEARHILADAEDMLGDPRIYHAPNWMCTDNGCAYYGPCVEQERGEDYKRTLMLDYQKREYFDRSAWAKHLLVGPKVGKEQKQLTQS